MAEVMPPIGLIAEPETSAAVPGCPKFGDRYEDFGCTVNAISVEELFTKYESSGFLYPAKRERLMPYMALIMENWRRSMSGQSNSILHDVVVHEDPYSGRWASVAIWATTNGSSHSQHLVSVGSTQGSQSVLLCGQSEMADREDISTQNWFRPENRFPSKIFGSCIHSLGDERAVVHEHAYLRVDRTRLPGAPTEIAVDELCNADASLIERLAQRLCGRVQARADEWDTGDVRLETLDARFGEVGLRRFRRVFLARVPGQQDPIGFAVAYRGPLGLNFSFLENRCELWVDPDSSPALHEQAIAALIQTDYGRTVLPLPAWRGVNEKPDRLSKASNHHRRYLPSRSKSPAEYTQIADTPHQHGWWENLTTLVFNFFPKQNHDRKGMTCTAIAGQ